MFHIKNDKRARKSAELVVNAFDECLKSHDFENMTITEPVSYTHLDVYKRQQ